MAHVKKREVFFNNLILLGFDKISHEKKYGIIFHKDMFAVPNKKGFEIVTYFLFSKLSAATGIDYNIQWPLVCKEHDRSFQKTCFSHLQNISREGCVKFPRIIASMLSTFAGNRFYNVYFAFSSYVIFKTIKIEGNVRLLSVPSVSRENYRTAKEILQLSTVLDVQKFKDTEVVSYSTHNILLNFAKILQNSLGELKHSLKIYPELRKKKIASIISLYSISDGSFNLSKITNKCFECLLPVLKERKILDKFLSSEQEYWQYLCSEVGENAENEFLNGQDYRIEVSDFLPEEYAKDLKDAGCLSSDENGKLSVERFIKILMAYLTFIVELLRKENLPDLHEVCFVENASYIEDDLKSIKNLNKKLSDEVIPAIQKNIEKFKILNGYDDIDTDLEYSDDQFCSLPMLSYDVESLNLRTLHFDASLEEVLSFSSEISQCAKKDKLVSLTKENFTKHSFPSLTDQNFTDSSSSSIVSSALSKEIMIVNPITLEERSLNYNCANQVPVQDTSSISNFNLSSLEDLDFSCSTSSKMRESWLAVESLNTMTFEDMSLKD